MIYLRFHVVALHTGSQSFPCTCVLGVSYPSARRMPTLRFVDLGEAPERNHDVEAVTVTEDTRHGDRLGELLEFLGCRVGHAVDDDVRV